MNYRKIYREKTGKKIPDDFEIHHLDQDRTNNEIDNLIAIPKRVHRQWHLYFNQITVLGFSANDYIPDVQNHNKIIYNADVFKGYLDACVEMSCWLHFRDYLLGKPSFKMLGYNY